MRSNVGDCRLQERLQAKKRKGTIIAPAVAAAAAVAAVEALDSTGSASAGGTAVSGDATIATQKAARAIAPAAATTGALVPASDPEASKRLQSSLHQIEVKLARMEKLMSAIQLGGTGTAEGHPETAPAPASTPSQPSPTAGQGQSNVFVDTNEPASGDALDVIAPNEIQVQEAARLEFGRHIASLLGLRSAIIIVSAVA